VDSYALGVGSFVLTVILLGLLPSRSNAAVFWDDGLEPGNTGYPIVGGMSYATSPVYGGTHSLKQHFLGSKVQGIQGGTYTDRYFPATEDLWSRYYLYLDNFVVDETQTKLMFQGSECCYPSFWWGMLFGQSSLSVQVQGIHGGTETVNIYGPSIPQNRWVCIETHIRMNTPGVANGVIEAWLDGSQGIARYDVYMRDSIASGKNSPTADFVLNRLYVQFGTGDLYFDNLATGNQRIGCSGVPPVQSQVPPPAQPVQNPQPTQPVQNPQPTQPTQTPTPTQPVQATPPTQPALAPPPAPEDLFFR
jgi:hypothetical protein